MLLDTGPAHLPGPNYRRPPPRRANAARFFIGSYRQHHLIPKGNALRIMLGKPSVRGVLACEDLQVINIATGLLVSV